MNKRNEAVSLRLSPYEKATLEYGMKVSGAKSLSGFIRDEAVASADSHIYHQFGHHWGMWEYMHPGETRDEAWARYMNERQINK
jgi:hypothetical protein